mmetsp:Transcript_13378/g.42012  ORF Transcript_13378/g.42012 Transcript_13378/m.42012 type:complete len:168 (+) Transcript_13378:401-904(+)
MLPCPLHGNPLVAHLSRVLHVTGPLVSIAALRMRLRHSMSRVAHNSARRAPGAPLSGQALDLRFWQPVQDWCPGCSATSQLAIQHAQSALDYMDKSGTKCLGRKQLFLWGLGDAFNFSSPCIKLMGASHKPSICAFGLCCLQSMSLQHTRETTQRAISSKGGRRLQI